MTTEPLSCLMTAPEIFFLKTVRMNMDVINMKKNVAKFYSVVMHLSQNTVEQRCSVRGSVGRRTYFINVLFRREHIDYFRPT